jgi:hypothetical protein
MQSLVREAVTVNCVTLDKMVETTELVDGGMRNYVIYEAMSMISGTGAAICTAVVVARCNGR